MTENNCDEFKRKFHECILEKVGSNSTLLTEKVSNLLTYSETDFRINANIMNACSSDKLGKCLSKSLGIKTDTANLNKLVEYYSKDYDLKNQ